MSRPNELAAQLQEILGPGYSIDRELTGAGMSRVFVATERELDRQVVVKILSPDLSAAVNAERFRREILLVARLQHPHIVPVLTAGVRGSFLYFTMPFIAGENLRTRMKQSPGLATHAAVRVLCDVAEALSYAHSKGVVHRDIKPENIILAGNHALVLDFGVSKALTKATTEGTADNSVITSLSVALGTPAYMAPEQAAADPRVDGRADIYALGIVAYELLSGQTPFGGLPPHQTLSAQIMKKPVPLSERQPHLPDGLVAIVMKCLEKNPSERYQTAEQLYAALEPYAVTSGATTPAESVPHRPFKWTPQRIGVAAAIAGLIVIGSFASTVAFKGDRKVLGVGATRQITSAPGLEYHPAISPDGRMIAFVAGTPERTQLFLRQVTGGRAVTLTDTSLSPRWVEWNPDGSEILFESGERSFTVPTLGGNPTPVTALDGLHQCIWSHAGDRFACANRGNGGLVVIDRDGGHRIELTGSDAYGVYAPAWSFDDRLIAFARGNGGFLSGADMGNIAPSSIWVVEASGGEPVRVSGDSHLNTSPVWTIDGALLFVSSAGGGRDIYLQRINRDREPRGDAVRVTTGLNPHTISISHDGKTVAYSAFTTVANIWVATDEGSAVANAAAAKPVTAGNQTIEHGFVSPDGKWLAYDSNVDGSQDIFRMPLDGGEPQQLTKNSYDDFHPTWSPDGKEIAFYSLAKGNRDIYVMNADGSGVDVIAEGPSEQRTPVWRGANEILYMVFPDSVFSVKRSGGEWERPKLAARSGATPVMYSPDGKWRIHFEKAKAVCDTCPAGMYVESTNDSESKYVPVRRAQISSIAGAGPWSKDSRHFYGAVREADGTSSIWQLPVNGDEERRVLHFTDPARQLYRSSFDVFGRNFYFTIGDRQSDIWTMELKKQ